MTLALTDFPLALVTIDDVLKVNDAQKAGEWERKSLLHHLTRQRRHVEFAMDMVAQGMFPGVVIGGHSLSEHIAHGSTRGIFALELHRRGQTR